MAQASASGGPTGRLRGAAAGAGRGGRGGARGVATSALSAPGRTRGRAARAESSAVRRGPPCGCLDRYPSRSRRFGNSCDEFCEVAPVCSTRVSWRQAQLNCARVTSDRHVLSRVASLNMLALLCLLCFNPWHFYAFFCFNIIKNLINKK